MIVSDNGTDPKATRSSQFTSTAILAWSQNHAIAWDCIAARKPTQNGFVESLQRPDARRTAEREPVPQPWPCPPELAAWTNDYLTAAAHAASLTATGRPPARLERCAARLVAHTTLRSVPNAATLVAAGRKLRGTSRPVARHPHPEASHRSPASSKRYRGFVGRPPRGVARSS